MKGVQFVSWSARGCVGAQGPIVAEVLKVDGSEPSFFSTPRSKDPISVLPLLLLFSDTRNAKDACAWVSWQATVRGIPNTLSSLSTYNMGQLPSESAVVFFVSTW